MRWPDWLRRDARPDDATDEGLDIDRVLAEGLYDLPSARLAVARLTRERKILVRRRKSVEASLKPLSRGRTRMIAHSTFSGGQGVEMGAYQLSQAMRDANASGHLVTQRKEQISSVDGRIREIDRALGRLREYARRAG